jgi:hypothetical protein
MDFKRQGSREDLFTLMNRNEPKQTLLQTDITKKSYILPKVISAVSFEASTPCRPKTMHRAGQSTDYKIIKK